MFNGVINKTSPVVDSIHVLTGVWNEYDSGEFHIVKTPFFTVITATLDAGKHPVPFKVGIPVAATVAHADGSVSAAILRPGETAVEIDSPGVFTMQVFGDSAMLEAVR